jgi:hypothetical protein
MQRFSFGKLTGIEKVLPYLIVLPFGYFIYDAYGRIRQAIIQDAKSGKIKSNFLSVWLKTIAVDEVILKDTQLRSETLNTLENIVISPQMKKSGLDFSIKISYTQPVISEICSLGNQLSKEMILEDEDSKQEMTKTAQNSNPNQKAYDSMMTKLADRLNGKIT